MGRRLLQQRRGRGGFPYRAPTHKRLGAVKYPPLSGSNSTETIKGTIVELRHEAGRGCPLAVVKFENGGKVLYLPPEGVFESETIQMGPDAPLKIGNIKPLGTIPEGTLIMNIEGRPGDGGTYTRSSGMASTVLEHSGGMTSVQLPSGKKHKMSSKCRATLGIVSAGGRTEKPFVKAGNKYYWTKSRGIKWPKARGVAMNAQSHPFGGGSHKSPHKPTTTSRNAPPGRKVGLIAARRTGNKKK
ncbi:MAG: 50S ribosomal protein L2 [Promethearchaeota archaeon]